MRSNCSARTTKRPVMPGRSSDTAMVCWKGRQIRAPMDVLPDIEDARRLPAQLQAGRSSSISATLAGYVVVVGRGVVNAIRGGHEVLHDTAELGLENTDIPPRVVRFIFRSKSPQVVPLAASSLGAAHDFEVQEMRGHDGA